MIDRRFNNYLFIYSYLFIHIHNSCHQREKSNVLAKMLF